MGNTFGFTYSNHVTQAVKSKHDLKLHLNKNGYCIDHPDIQLRVKHCCKWKTILPSCPKCNEERMLKRIREDKEKELEKIRLSLEKAAQSTRLQIETHLLKKRHKREILQSDIRAVREMGYDPAVAILNDEEGFPYLDYALCFAVNTTPTQNKNNDKCMIS